MSLENFMLKPGGRGGGGGGFLNFQKWGDYPKWGGVVFEMGGLNPSTNYANTIIHIITTIDLAPIYQHHQYH